MSEELKELLGSKADAFEANQELVQSAIAVCGGKLSVLLPALLCLIGDDSAKKKAASKKKS
ncbi:hypothetical protein CMI37_16150 [Candidatus Pacearchaeota archaeon]|nr:hypothetical protein [Candidatus Pacearchaeota archaeon]|tara:strand:+ start:287 stop:469 length:183 start_codon:yes stop_codon:yes gene_type:complete